MINGIRTSSELTGGKMEFRVASVGGNITWTYDTVSSGHHPRVQETTTPGTVTVEYDEIGRRVKLSATGQTDVTYTYDKNSRLKTVAQGAQTVTLAYDDAGRRTGLTYPNGAVTSYGYDNANRLLSINHVKTPTTIEALTYQNDAAGNRIKLTRANAAASLIPQAVSNTAFDAANEQTRFNSASTNLVYDSNGNLTSFTDTSGTTTYTWNARNQLTAISGPSLSASFVYDGLGRRTSKTINSTTTGFWYDGADVLAELSGGTPTATYIRSLSIDEPFIRRQTGGDEFYQTDGLGTALALTDGAGASSTTYTQEPFGNTTRTGASTNSFQFTGRENDGTGLQYHRARYYHPKLQRFMSEDPIDFFSGDLNLYGYVKNNPTNLTDSTGAIVDTLADLGFIGYDIYRLAIDGRKHLGSNLAALGLDIGGAFTPFVTGLGVTSRVAKKFPDLPASIPVGRSGNPINVVGPGGKPLNVPAAIGGRTYSGHALDQMQGRGIPPSVVDNAIHTGTTSPGKYPGTNTHYDSVNNITAVTNSKTGNVVTVHPGPPSGGSP